MDVHTKGSDVWVRDDKEGWLKATVVRVDGTHVVVRTENEDERSVAVSECPLQNNDARAGVEVRLPDNSCTRVAYSSVRAMLVRACVVEAHAECQTSARAGAGFTDQLLPCPRGR
jgi:hypothetical protein